MSKTTLKDIEGMEFDWFAYDDELNVAIFSTAGYGTIPKKIKADLDTHIDFADTIPCKFTGNWNTYTKKAGVFVYDWDDKSQQYIQVGSPNKPFIGNVLALPNSTHEIKGFFGDLPSIKIK
jgi:hypothetical protein